MKILLVDDDPALLRVLGAHLSREGYEVVEATSGRQALRTAYEAKPDLILLDIVIPQGDGFETCERLRELSDVPIIFLTGMGDEEDIVRGLNCGGDDYIVKPFSMSELSARVAAVIRRAAHTVDPEPDLEFDDGVLKVDLREGTVHRRGRQVALSPKESALLTCLVRHAGTVVTYDQILEQVWGSDYAQAQNYLTLYIYYLRQKLEDDPSKPRYIQTRTRKGYCFVADGAVDGEVELP